MKRVLVTLFVAIIITTFVTPVLAKKYLCFGVSRDFREFVTDGKLEKDVNADPELASLMKEQGYDGFRLMLLDSDATLIARVRLKQVEIFTSGPLCLNAIEPIRVHVPLKFLYRNSVNPGKYSGTILYHRHSYPSREKLYSALQADAITVYANSPTSSSGFMLQQLTLERDGINVDPNQRNVFFTGSHRKVMKNVLEDPSSVGFCGSFMLQELNNPGMAHIKTESIPTNGVYFTQSLVHKTELYNALVDYFRTYGWGAGKHWYLSVEPVDSEEYLGKVRKFDTSSDDRLTLWLLAITVIILIVIIVFLVFTIKKRRKEDPDVIAEPVSADFNSQDFHDEVEKFKDLLTSQLYYYLHSTYRHHDEQTLDVSAVMAGKAVERMLKELHAGYVDEPAKVRKEETMIQTLLIDLKKVPSLEVRRVEKMINQVQDMRNTAAHDNPPIEKNKSNVLFSCMIHVLDWYMLHVHNAREDKK